MAKTTSKSVNNQITDAISHTQGTASTDWQQQMAQGAYQLLEIGLQNNMAAQQLAQESLGQLSGWYKSYYDTINSMTQHSWATYSSLWTDPLGLSSLIRTGQER